MQAKVIIQSSLLTFSLVASSLVSGADICSKLTATGNSEYPPYLWRSGEGVSLLGANSIIMDEIAKRLNIEIDLQDVGSWARAQKMLKTGQIDMIAGAFYTVPRIQYMDYVYPAFLDTNSVVWRRTGSSLSYSDRPDLKDKTVTTVINNSFGQSFDEYAKKELELNQVASLEQGFKMLVKDRTDFVLYEKNPGLAYANEWGLANQIEVTGSPISSEGLYLTVSHKSQCNTGALRGQLAKVVQEMMAEGFMQKALEQGLESWKRFTQK